MKTLKLFSCVMIYAPLLQYSNNDDEWYSMISRLISPFAVSVHRRWDHRWDWSLVYWEHHFSRDSIHGILWPPWSIIVGATLLFDAWFCKIPLVQSYCFNHSPNFFKNNLKWTIKKPPESAGAVLIRALILMLNWLGSSSKPVWICLLKLRRFIVLSTENVHTAQIL
jgi:hypothetical protein